MSGPAGYCQWLAWTYVRRATRTESIMSDNEESDTGRERSAFMPSYCSTCRNQARHLNAFATAMLAKSKSVL